MGHRIPLVSPLFKKVGALISRGIFFCYCGLGGSTFFSGGGGAYWRKCGVQKRFHKSSVSSSVIFTYLFFRTFLSSPSVLVFLFMKSNSNNNNNNKLSHLLRLLCLFTLWTSYFRNVCYLLDSILELLVSYGSLSPQVWLERAVPSLYCQLFHQSVKVLIYSLLFSIFMQKDLYMSKSRYLYVNKNGILSNEMF